jgi:membrane protein DedA with SNARE-associated domain
MHELTQSILGWIEIHQAWTAPVVFVLSFCESFAFVSLIVPATGILVALGAVIGATGLTFWPIWSAAVLGAIAGDWLAYYLAFHYKDSILKLWPFTRHEQWVARGNAFYQRWGLLAVFGGRFFGPLRAVVPIAAGIYAMPWLQFQAANTASALVWATAILTPGFLGIRWLVS